MVRVQTSKKNKTSHKRIFISIAVVLVLGFLVVFCNFVAYPYLRDNVLAKPLEGTVITPSVDNANFYSTEAYGGPDAPWGFYHNGIDFLESVDHQAIQAAADGKIERLEERFNEGSNWQVELTIKHGKYDLQYAFEIFSGNKADIDAQMADINVKLGQNVKQGQLLGYLHRIKEGAHVHFGIAKKNQVVCPAPYFTPQARDAVLAMIRKTYPDAQICYPADPTAPRKTPGNMPQTTPQH